VKLVLFCSQSPSKAIKLEPALTSAQKVCQRFANLQLAGDMNRHLAEVVLPDEPKFSESYSPPCCVSRVGPNCLFFGGRDSVAVLVIWRTSKKPTQGYPMARASGIL
jgi:hypothetical protein